MALVQTEPQWLANTFLARLGADASCEVQDLEEFLQGSLASAKERWPGVELEPAHFVHHLAKIVSKLEGPPLPSLQALRISDIYLASACACGDEQAIAVMDREVLPLVLPALRSMGASATVIDETMQSLRDILFVAAPDREPTIASYAGRAQLRSWVRSIALRTASKLVIGPKEKSVGDEVLERLPATDDPELEFLKAQYGETFRTCLHAQLADLTQRQRNILRQHFMDGLSIDQLGSLYSVHRATAARWLAATRQILLEGTRERLMRELKVSETEFDSIARLVRSQLDISLQRLL